MLGSMRGGPVLVAADGWERGAMRVLSSRQHLLLRPPRPAHLAGDLPDNQCSVLVLLGSPSGLDLGVAVVQEYALSDRGEQRQR